MKNLQNLQVEDYIGILKRRLLWILVPGLLAWIATFLYVRRLPSIYISETVILVEPPKVPSEYVRPTSVGTVQSRLSTISQQIMSRTRLEKIILDNNLYVEKLKTTPMEVLVETMRNDLDLIVNKTDAFTLAYSALDPLVAQKVTSEVASLYIEENLKSRSEQTEGVTQFIESQLQETETKLKELEDRTSGFKMRNLGALPEQQNANLAALSRLQLQLQSSADAVNRLEEKKAYMRRMSTEFATLTRFRMPVQASRTNAADGTPESPAGSTPYVELEKKKAQRETLLGRWTSDHPDVRKLEKEIAALEKQAASHRGKEDSPVSMPAQSQEQDLDSDQVLARAEMQAELDALDKQIQQATQEQERIKREMSLYQVRIDSVPRIEQMLKEISRDYEITRKHYQDLLAKKNDAQMATSLEKRQKGEQFRILDPASLPEQPSAPDRLKLNLAGLVLGLAFGIGLSLVLELTDESVRSEHEVTVLTQLPVLVSIPLIEGPNAGNPPESKPFFGFLGPLKRKLLRGLRATDRAAA